VDLFEKLQFILERLSSVFSVNVQQRLVVEILPTRTHIIAIHANDGNTSTVQTANLYTNLANTWGGLQ